MFNEGKLPGWINPLAFAAAEWRLSDEADSIDADELLSFLRPPRTTSDIKGLVERYRKISAKEEKLRVVPAEPGILEKLVWPLRNAKASYVLGNNLAVVALCGVVAEMVSVLLLRLAKTELKGKALEEPDGATFEECVETLRQADREKILGSHGIVSEEVIQMFRTIRTRRRGYLHRWSQDHACLAKDAEECYGAATGLVVVAIGQDFSDGKFMLNPKLAEFLQQEGVYQPSLDSEARCGTKPGRCSTSSGDAGLIRRIGRRVLGIASVGIAGTGRWLLRLSGQLAR